MLSDRQGRAWLRVASMNVSLEDLLSSRPIVRKLRAFSAEMIVHCEDGICRPPLLDITSDDWSELRDLDGVAVHDVTLTIRNDDEVVSLHTVPLMSYKRKPGSDPRLDVTSGVGTFAFSDLRANDFVAGADSIEFGRLTGKLGGGQVILTGRADRDPNGLWQASGKLLAKRVDLQQLHLRITGGEQGVMTGMLDFRLDSPDANGLTGKGMAFIEGADLSGVALAKALLQSAGLKKSEMLTNANGDGLFHLSGAMLTLDQARVSLPLAAVDIEPGATINVATGQLDGVAVVVLFERVRDMIKSLPLVGLMVDLTERFSRFRVQGFWQDDDSIRVTPAATSNVTSQTRKFLTDAARGRKRLGRGILDTLGMPEGSSTAITRPASVPTTRPVPHPAGKTGP